MTTVGPVTDGVVVVRPLERDDVPLLVAGRDDASRRFLGPGDPDPRPAGVVTVGGRVAGWVDHDGDRSSLLPGERNLGYHLFPEHRGCGVASRAVQLLLHDLALHAEHRVATLLIHPENEPSLSLGRRLGFVRTADIDGQRCLMRPVPPLTYTDGAVTIRRQEVGDLDTDLEAKDDEQIRWLWLPGQRESWQAMSPDEQREHARRGLVANRDAFGTGPKWTFAVDCGDARAVGYVDCDLANLHVPHGEANVSYATHPAHRGQGVAARAVHLVLRFLSEHTGAREAHVIADERNAPSMRVAASVGAIETERFTGDEGQTMVRHVVDVRRPAAG